MTEELRKVLLLFSQQETLTMFSLAVTMAVALGCGLAIYLLYRFFIAALFTMKTSAFSFLLSAA